eukprot:5721004-Pyramimonas_sp.AAC.1
MIEAARYARNALIVHKPQSKDARLMVIRTCARAFYRQDMRLARRVFSSHALAREHLVIDEVASVVSLRSAADFAEVSDALHADVSRRRRLRVQESLAAAGSEQRQARLRGRVERMKKAA